jgi:phosphoesterase RecJ-like protein
VINPRLKAAEILSEIKKAKKILLALHVSPDPDSAASVLAMGLVLRRLGKKTTIISYSQIPPRLLDWPGIEKVEMADFSQIDLKEFDLMVALDSADRRMITRSDWPSRLPRNFKIINIDHHFSNTRFGRINLVAQVSSTTEILYHLLELWQIKIDKKLADLLFRGIFGDTGCFQYQNTSATTMRVGADLMEKGASLNECVLREFRSYSFKTLKYWGKVLENMQLDKSGKFVWSKVSQKECEELGVCSSEIEGAASLFTQIVSGTEFGIIINEESENLVRVSLRSRDSFDVSRIAVEQGGGGHKKAAGFSLKMPLLEAEKKVLEAVKRVVSSK